jgi:hypothetical protein
MSEAEGARRVKRVGSYSVEEGTYTLDGVTYELSDLPDSVLRWSALRGVAMALTAADDPAAEWARLKAGEVRHRGGGGAVLKGWRLAYANALLAKVNPRRGPAVMTEAEARAAALGLSAEELAQVRFDPTVVKEYRALSRSSGDDEDLTPLERAVAAARARQGEEAA